MQASQSIRWSTVSLVLGMDTSYYTINRERMGENIITGYARFDFFSFLVIRRFFTVILFLFSDMISTIYFGESTNTDKITHKHFLFLTIVFTKSKPNLMLGQCFLHGFYVLIPNTKDASLIFLFIQLF